MPLQLLTFQRLVWPKMGRYSQGESGPKDTHSGDKFLSPNRSALFCSSRTDIFERGKERRNRTSFGPRTSREAGIESRERGPDLKEKLLVITESLKISVMAEGVAGKPLSSIPCANSGTPEQFR